MTNRFARLTGALLRQEREQRGMTQAVLAGRAGATQAAVARIESGTRAASPALLDRLFAALDLQLRVEVEPLDAHLDATLDELLAVPIGEHISDLRLDVIAETLADLPAAFDGPTAALLQGAPLPAEAVHLTVPWAAATAFTDWLSRRYGHRWNPAWREFGYLPLDPHHDAPHRWRTRDGVIAARMVDELPATIEVRHQGQNYRAVPLIAIEVDDRRTAELLSRYRKRLSGDPSR